MPSEESCIYKVTGVTPTLLTVEVVDVEGYHNQPVEKKLSIGSYLKISDDKDLTIIAIAQSFKVRDTAQTEQEAAPRQPVLIIEAQQVGCLENGAFKRGGQQISIPPSRVETATEDDLRLIYAGVEEPRRFSFGTMAQFPGVRVVVDGDRFFGKHIGVVGSTGAGKSCTVAKLIQEGVKPSDGQTAAGVLNNAHVIVFDLHGEYKTAFPSGKHLTVDDLALPYWLMDSEELEEMFIESQEMNSHNQVSQFKLAVIKNKEKYNPGAKVNYDTPAYFSLTEVHRYIRNLNCATKDAKTRELKIKEPVDGVREEYQLFENVTFEEKAPGKVNGGPYEGEFDRFVSRLEARLQDERLGFLLCPAGKDGMEYRTSDLASLLRQFTGYGSSANANVTVVDLSGIPFEVLSIVVSLITRLIFDFCFHFQKSKGGAEEVPFLLVYEEAHRYVPRSEGARYSSVKKSIERVAKEGRKYGISLMVVSQRPSEISETIFSQCNNFVAMRLTNPADQNYIRRLLPDSVSAVTDSLPVLEKQEAIVIGDAVAVPSWVGVDSIRDKPKSDDINFHTEWKKDWYDPGFEAVVRRMRNEVEPCDQGAQVEAGDSRQTG